jgi:hypothetical protein
MKILFPSPFKIGWMVGRVRRPGISISIFVKGTFRIVHGEISILADEGDEMVGDVYRDGDPTHSLLYPSDFVPFKPCADTLVIATAFAPNRLAIPHFPVVIRIGGLSKTLIIYGERRWKRVLFGWVPGEAIATGSESIIYENAWGGKDYFQNPTGRGRITEVMHNVEFPSALVRNKNDVIAPAGFGPLASSWEPRCKKSGTYNREWLNGLWPWFPSDFDWSYFNAAPPDQQLEGYLRGDEELEFMNLHAQRALYKSFLPGLRLRCFLNECLPSDDNLFREVPLNLDTLWVNMDEEKLVLVWRGLAPVRTHKLREIKHLYVVTEMMTEPPQALEEHRAQFELSLNEGIEVDLPDRNDAMADAAFEKQFVDMEKEFGKAEEEMLKAEADVMRMFEEVKGRAMTGDLDPGLFEEQGLPQTLEEGIGAYQAAMEEVKRVAPDQVSHIEEIDLSEGQKMEAEMAQMESDMAKDSSPRLTREFIEAQLQVGEKCFADQDLSGLDLSRLDLAGADLSRTSLRNTNLQGTKLVRAKVRDANLRGANLTEADLTGAALDGADFSNAILLNINITDVSITDAIFAKLELASVDFSGATGKGADFS